MTTRRLSKTTLAAAVCAGAAIWTSFGLLAVTSADSTRRIGILPSPWLLAIAVLAATGCVAALRLSPRASLPLFLSLLIVLPWTPLPLPDGLLALLVWTGPAVRVVWGAIALSMIAVAGPSIALRLKALDHPRRAPFVAAALAVVILLAVRSGQRPPPTGDEPHYLVITQSLLADRDVAVGNNYDRGDYRQYYAGFLEPHASVASGDGKAYSVHSPGLPAIIAPAFALGGYPAAVVWVAIIAAVGTAFVWQSGYLLTGDTGAAWFGWAVVALTMPCAVHGSLIYPDSAAGCVLAGGVVALVLASRDRGWPIAASVALAVAIGALPWLHTRLVLPAAALGGLIFLHVAFDRAFRDRRWRHLAALVAPAALVVLGWFAFFWTIHHTFSPVAAYGNVVPLELRRIGPGLLGLLADQEFGLFPSAPVHLVSLVGLWWVFRRSARLGVELLLVAVPYFVAVSAYDLWWGGFTPPARFLLPLVFVGGIAAASFWAGAGPRGRAVGATLLGVSGLVAAALAFGGDGALAYNTSSGRARLLDWVSPLVDLPRAFPSFFSQASAIELKSAQVWPIVLWAGVLLVAWTVFILIDRRLPADRRIRALVAPLCLALALTAGVAASWIRRGETPVMATRAQLDVIRGRDSFVRPLGVQPFPAGAMAADDVPPRLAISTSRLEPPSPGTLLFLPELPAGQYRVRLKRRADAYGQIAFGIGLATLPFARWSLADDPSDRFTITLPVHASSLVVLADADAARSVEDTTLVPARRPPALAPVPGRARDAARFGSRVIYALDDRVWIEPGGFWVMGERQPDVLFAFDEAAAVLPLEILNGPIVNRIRIRAGGWSIDHRLAPDERWPIPVPVAGLGQAVVVNFDVERAFRPIDVDSQSRDRRSLGCWISIQ